MISIPTHDGNVSLSGDKVFAKRLTKSHYYCIMYTQLLGGKKCQNLKAVIFLYTTYTFHAHKKKKIFLKKNFFFIYFFVRIVNTYYLSYCKQYIITDIYLNNIFRFIPFDRIDNLN